jgi:hypothetical protein
MQNDKGEYIDAYIPRKWYFKMISKFFNDFFALNQPVLSLFNLARLATESLKEEITLQFKSMLLK